MKEILKTLSALVMFIVVIWGFYIGMVLEPRCEQKGFAGVDRAGCYIIKNGVRVHE